MQSFPAILSIPAIPSTPGISQVGYRPAKQNAKQASYPSVVAWHCQSVAELSSVRFKLKISNLPHLLEAKTFGEKPSEILTWRQFPHTEDHIAWNKIHAGAALLQVAVSRKDSRKRRLLGFVQCIAAVLW